MVDVTDLSYSLGMTLSSNGMVFDVLHDLSAWRAGIGPGMQILAVNKARWSVPALQTALRSESGSIEFLVRDGDKETVVTVNYRGGARYPRLVADPARDDWLEQIIRPQTPRIR